MPIPVFDPSSSAIAIPSAPGIKGCRVPSGSVPRGVGPEGRPVDAVDCRSGVEAEVTVCRSDAAKSFPGSFCMAKTRKHRLVIRSVALRPRERKSSGLVLIAMDVVLGVEGVDGIMPIAAEISQNSMYPVPNFITFCSKIERARSNSSMADVQSVRVIKSLFGRTGIFKGGPGG